MDIFKRSITVFDSATSLPRVCQKSAFTTFRSDFLHLLRAYTIPGLLCNRRAIHKSKAGRRGNNEGSIYQRKSDGLWCGAVTTGYKTNGKPMRKTLHT